MARVFQSTDLGVRRRSVVFDIVFSFAIIECVDAFLTQSLSGRLEFMKGPYSFYWGLPEC